MITGWRHNDLQKTDKVFREEVQKEFERLYNLDAGSKAFDKAVKDALASLLDPKNPNGFGTDGIPGANGINGQGNGRDGIGTKGDKGGDGKDGKDGTGKGGGGSEELSMYNSFVDFKRAEKTSGVATLQELIGASGSGLSWNSSKSSQGMYSPTNGNAIAHAVTSKWSRFPIEPLNETRLFPTSYKFDDWTDTANILATHPDAFDTDGTLKKPYFISDIGADAFGHISKVKISNLRDIITEPPYVDILEPLRIPNIKQKRNAREYGGLAWYDETTLDLVPDIADVEGRYNGSIKRFIGHGQTSDWTVQRARKKTAPFDPVIPYDPSKNKFMPNHHFYQGDWDLHRGAGNENVNRIGGDDNGAINGVPAGTPIVPARYSVVVDLNSDTYGHIQWAQTEELMPLTAGRGLHYSLNEPDYLPAYEREIEHYKHIVQTYTSTPLPFGTTLVGQDSNGEDVYRSGGGTVGIDPLELPSTTAPRVPTGFVFNDSGHIEQIYWTTLPKIWGPKGDKGDTPVVNAYVAATNSLPYGSPASVSVVDVDSGPNANWAFTFNIPKGKDGTDGTDGNPGAPASVAAVINTVTTGTPNVSVANWGTTQNAIFAFDFVLPPGGDITIIGDTYYNQNIQNIGYYGSWRSLVYNPGANNPVYIKRVSTDSNNGIFLFELGDTIIWGHSNVSGTYISSDWLYTSGGGFAGTAAYIEPKNNGDGTWTFPGFEMNSTGHIINAYPVIVPMGGGSYTWNAATATGTTLVNSGNTVRFLSSDISKLEITQSGGNITFDIKNTAFTLQPLEFGNGLSQDANSAITPGFNYDPYTGATVHVNNNTRDLAGIVRKGDDPNVLEVTSGVWGKNSTNQPNWRPTIRLKGSRYISLIEETPGVYAISLVN